VHRDIKPENMLLGRRGEVLLSDFGIATVAQSTTSQKTEGVAGTAAYMAPEQIQGKPRPSSDLYSLAVVVYEWLAGERPFLGTFTEVASQHLFAAPPPLREKAPGIAPLLEQVVMTALAKDPKDRFGSVRAFATAFAQASGVDVSASMLATRAGLPPTPSAALSSQPGITVTAASQMTPQITPQLSVAPTLVTPAGVSASQVPQPGIPSAAAQSGSQYGPEVLFSPTQLIPAGAMPALAFGGSGPHAAAAPATYTGASATPGNAPGAATYLPPGWAVTPTAGKPPANVTAPPAPAGGGKPRKGLRVALMVLAAVVALALIGGAGAFGLPLLLHAASTPAAGATVTITPKQSDLSNTFNLTAVTGTPDSSQNQVGARSISATTQKISQTVNATGTATIPGTRASGTLIVYNYDTNNPLSIPAGSTFENTGGCTPNSLVVVFDGDVNLAAAPPGGGAPGYNTNTTVQAHIQQVGAIGNFPAQPSSYISRSGSVAPLSGSCHSFGYYRGACQYPFTNCLIILSQSAFTGGTDPQTVTAVAQSDINNTANSLIQANQPNAQQVVQNQLKANEQLAGTPQCQPNTSANHNAGDVANTVTVTVTFTCTGEAFDRDGAFSLAEQLLKNQAASNPGQGFALAGKIKPSLVSAADPDNQGNIALVVKAEGVWAYQFSDAQMQTLARLIAGKSKQDALTALGAQTGVAQANIQINGGSGQTLPAQASEISIKVQAVAGL
jgi:VCBS repeat-containing protein